MNIIPQLITYASTEADVTRALSAGATHLILEDSKLSLRPFHDDFNVPNFDKLETLATLARTLNAQVELSFNLDIIPHKKHFPLIHDLITTLTKASVFLVRIQDPGLSEFFKEVAPQFELILHTETGNQNTESIAYFSHIMARQVLVNDLPHKDISHITQSLAQSPYSLGLLRNAPDVRFIEGRGLPRSRSVSEDGVVEPFENRADGVFRNSHSLEIQVQGPILIQNSPRPFMGQLPTMPLENALVVRKSQAQEYPGRFYTFYQNPHGHLMYAYFERSLIKLIPQLYELNLSGWIIDGRGNHPDYITTALTAYRTERDAYIQNKAHYKVSQSTVTHLEKIAPLPQKPGFFKINQTDTNRIKKSETLMEDEVEIGKIIDSIPGKIATIEVKRPFTTHTPLTLLTPEGRRYPLTLTTLHSIWDTPITTASTGDLVKVNWQKGCQVKSKIVSNR